MTDTPPVKQHEITELLEQWSGGNQSALDRLYPLVYEELRRLARSYMKREHEGHTLQTTALINEAYVRLVDQHNVHWQNRSHFFAISAQIMRRILVDHARARRYQKRGGDAVKVTFDEALVVTKDPREDFVALDDALEALARFDERKSRVIELRFFGGLSVEETAEVLRVSPITVMREWKSAKAWLYRELAGPTAHGQ